MIVTPAVILATDAQARAQSPATVALTPANLAGVGVLTGLLFGMTLSNAADATNDITTTAGACADSTGVRFLVGGAMTKRIDAAWAVGDGNGGLMSAAALTNATYHYFAILKDSDGTVDYGFDASATAPTMPTGYTYFRRIGSVVRAGATILAFTQIGDHFQLTTPVNDIALNNPGTSAVLVTLSVPKGIKVTAQLDVALYDNTALGATYGLITSPDQADTAAGFGFANLATTGTGALIAERQAARLEVRTDTSGRIRTRIDASDADRFVNGSTVGWYDTRGRFA